MRQFLYTDMFDFCRPGHIRTYGIIDVLDWFNLLNKGTSTMYIPVINIKYKRNVKISLKKHTLYT